MRKIGIAIPTYNRYQFTIDCFKQVIDDERIESITIVDDASTDDSYEKLKWYFRDNDKVRLFRNEANKDCYFNKHEAVEKSNSEWICLWDSDNVFDMEYIDTLYSIPQWSRNIFYQPQFLKPAFDFRKWSGLMLTKENIAEYANTDLMTACNASNYFIHREEYLKTWNGSVNPISSDSIFFAFTWVSVGNKILITPNLEYFHTLHEDKSGHFNQNQHKTVRFHEELMHRIKQLK